MKHVFEDDIGGGRSPTDVKSLEERIKLLEAQLFASQQECESMREAVRARFRSSLERVLYEGEG